MKIFLAYKFAGENKTVLDKEIGAITNAIEKAGHQIYCSYYKEKFFKSNKYTNKQILDYSLKHLLKADAVLAYIKSKEKSGGMLIEIGYAYANKKPIYAAMHQDVKLTFVPEIAKEVIRFDDLSNLLKKIPNIF